MATMTLNEGAKDLVIRARNGDQNAMGMISEIRKQAGQGNLKAKEGFEAIHKYIQRNPTKENQKASLRDSTMGSEAIQVIRDLKKSTQKRKSSFMGAEETPTADDAKETCIILLALPCVGGERALNAGTIALANGPALTDNRIREMGSAIKNDGLRSLFYEYVVKYTPSDSENSVPDKLMPLVKAGQVTGQARALQIARLPGSPISGVSPQVGYELGEVDRKISEALRKHVAQYHAES